MERKSPNFGNKRCRLRRYNIFLCLSVFSIFIMTSCVHGESQPQLVLYPDGTVNITCENLSLSGNKKIEDGKQAAVIPLKLCFGRDPVRLADDGFSGTTIEPEWLDMMKVTGKSVDRKGNVEKLMIEGSLSKENEDILDFSGNMALNSSGAIELHYDIKHRQDTSSKVSYDGTDLGILPGNETGFINIAIPMAMCVGREYEVTEKVNRKVIVQMIPPLYRGGRHMQWGNMERVLIHTSAGGIEFSATQGCYLVIRDSRAWGGEGEFFYVQIRPSAKDAKKCSLAFTVRGVK